MCRQGKMQRPLEEGVGSGHELPARPMSHLASESSTRLQGPLEGRGPSPGSVCGSGGLTFSAVSPTEEGEVLWCS